MAAPAKFLVYTTVGVSEEYVKCAGMLLASLRAYTSRDSIHLVDVLVLCDDSVQDSVRQMINDHNVAMMLTPAADAEAGKEQQQQHQEGGLHAACFAFEKAANGVQASVNKLRVFDFTGVSGKDYDIVMFLDADMLCLTDVAHFLTGVTIDARRPLCAFKETVNTRQHQNVFFAPKKNHYSAEDLKGFERDRVYPFNAGCFLFSPTKDMAHHFRAVLEEIRECKTAYFYEQSHMNSYFNTRRLVDYGVITASNYVIHPRVQTNHAGKMVHFTGKPGDGRNKQDVMLGYIKRFALPIQS